MHLLKLKVDKREVLHTCKGNNTKEKYAINSPPEQKVHSAKPAIEATLIQKYIADNEEQEKNPGAQGDQ